MSSTAPFFRGLLGAVLVPALLTLGPTQTRAAPPAQPVPETASASVALAGLDLTTPTGVLEAHDRMAAAARRLCLKFMDERKVSALETYADCVHDTLTDARHRLEVAINSQATSQLSARSEALGRSQ
ncbi:MAG: UrcA family protein [Steroidobacteraceae bacterium]